MPKVTGAAKAVRRGKFIAIKAHTEKGKRFQSIIFHHKKLGREE